MLPNNHKGVPRLVGLRTGPLINSQQQQMNESQTQSMQKLDMKELDRMAVEMTDRITRQPETVTFDASFECANLDQVRQREPKVFDIWMRNDTNGSGELQWFMFKMRNSFEGQVRINVVNFTKTKSLFNNVSFYLLLNNTHVKYVGNETIILLEACGGRR